MKKKICTKFRKQSFELAAQWLKTLVPEDEAESVTVDSVKEFEKTQDQYIYTQAGERICSAYSSKSFYKKLKKSYLRGVDPEFLVTRRELG